MTEAGRNLSTTIAPPVLRGAIPFVGMLPALSRDPLSVFMQARTLGDVVRLVVPGRHPISVLAHPAHIRHVLQEKHGNYRRTPFHDRLKIIIGTGSSPARGSCGSGNVSSYSPLTGPC